MDDEIDCRNIVFVTDEGSNLIKALRFERRLNCSAHVLNTALKAFYDAIGHTTEAASLNACEALVGHIRRSHMKAQLSKKVVPYVETRWHSKVNMIESVLDMWDEIDQLLLERRESHYLDDIDKSALERLFALLKPVRETILQLETSTKYPTLPLVALNYQEFMNLFVPSPHDLDSVSLMKSKLWECIQRKLRIEIEHRLATILHPSFRKLQLQFLTEFEKNDACNRLRSMLVVDENGGDADFNGSTSSIEAIEEGPNRKRCRPVADKFLEKYCSPMVEGNLANELDAYLGETVSPVSFAEVLDWWKKAALTYPKLANIARKYLAVPATSAASESAFRYAGLTITDLRNRLSPKTASNLLFVRHNARDI